jgi:pantetheine-phosphate adenylyltransferase
MQKTGLFAGSFDPFTIGHDDIVRRALPLFDRLVIGVGVNRAKDNRDDAERRAATIADLYAGDDRVTVVTYDDLTVDLAHRVGATCLVRGVRTVKDFEYERDMADLNRRVGHVETLLLPARPELAAISSSAARELRSFGKDIAWMLPTRQGDR